MRKFYILSPILMVIGLAILYSASAGVAKVQQRDRTGGPVSDETCIKCHISGISFISSSSIVATDSSGAVVTAYKPLNTYTITLNINSSGDSGHGFQLTGLLSDNTFAGLVPSVNNGQKTVLNSRWYFENGQLETGGVYSFSWIAPAASQGTVTFYGSALAANGDGKTAGDDYESIPDLVLTEASATGVAEVQGSVAVKLYPNPAVNEVTLESKEIVNYVTVYSANGVLVKEVTANAKQVSFDVSNLPKGVYVVHMTTENGVEKSSFIKN